VFLRPSEVGVSTRTEVCSRPGPKRINFFDGRLLTASDFRAEQAYLLGELRRLTRATLGRGVIDGLQVTGDGQGVVVAPGVAVDGLGRLVELDRRCRFTLPARRGAWDLYVELVEAPSDPVPAPPAQPPGAGDALQCATTQQSVTLWLRRRAPRGRRQHIAGAVWLAHLVAVRGRIVIESAPRARAIHRR
jgi:hypothetical protein